MEYVTQEPESGALPNCVDITQGYTLEHSWTEPAASVPGPRLHLGINTVLLL